jgi:hypothetical protein
MIQRIQTIYLLIPTIIGSVAILAIIDQPNNGNLFFGVSSIINFISIFLFKRRELQIAAVFLSSLIFTYLLFNPILIGICVTSLLFNILGYKAIKKDIELLKNSDRLR